MSSNDVRVYGLHGEVLGEDGGGSNPRSVRGDVHPEPPMTVPVTRLCGSFASSGLGSDESRDRREREDAWQSRSWGDHDSWGDSEWGGQWASHSDGCWRQWQWTWRGRDDDGGDRHHRARPERQHGLHDPPRDRGGPEADGRERAPRRHDPVERRGDGKGSRENASTTSTEEEPHDPWLEAKRRQVPPDRQAPQRDPWEGYTRGTSAKDAVWEGWQHFDYMGESDREVNRSQTRPVDGNRPTERLTVPSFNGQDDGDEVGTTARSYLRQVEAWRRMTRLPAAQQGLVLYQNLSGKAWVAAEELNVDKLSAGTGVQYLVKWISGRYLDLEITRIGKAFSEFFRRLRRRPGQSIREYNAEYDRLHARLREVGCCLPEDCAAWLYVDRLQLEESAELNLLASVGNAYSLHKLQKAAVIQDRGLRKPWEGSGGRGKKAHTAHFTGHDEGDSTESDTKDDEDEGIPEDVAQAYVTYQSAKQKYKDQQRARGYVGGDNGNSTEGRDEKLRAMKAKSFCSGCGRRGHWHKDAECPKNKTGTSLHAAPRPDIKEVGMCNVLPAEVYAAKHEGEFLLGITDTACARTVAGTQWLQKYTDSLAKLGHKPLLHKECEAYRFGTGKVHYSAFYVVLGFELGSKVVQVRTSIINGDVPLLLSKGVLSRLGMIYDVEMGRADFTKVGLRGFELQMTSSGHPAIPIIPAKVAGDVSAGLQAEDLRLSPREQYTVYAVAHGSFKSPTTFNIFYDKKLDPGVRDMLCQEHSHQEAFLAWWKSTGTTSDFWLESPEAWIRVHMTPRKILFNPSVWQTRASLQKEMLLQTAGEVRITEGACCATSRWLEPVVDRWENGNFDEHAFGFLWAGRTWISKRYSPHDLLRAPDHGARAMPTTTSGDQPDEQGRAPQRSHEVGPRCPSDMGSGGDQSRDRGAQGEPEGEGPRGADAAGDAYDVAPVAGEGGQLGHRLPVRHYKRQPHAPDQRQPQHPGSRTYEDREVPWIPICGDPRELLRVGDARAGGLQEPRPGTGSPEELVSLPQGEDQRWLHGGRGDPALPERADCRGYCGGGIHGKVIEEREPDLERYSKIVRLGSREREEFENKAQGPSRHDRGEGDGGRRRPDDGSRDRRAGDSPRDPEGQGDREEEVNRKGGSGADGMEGDAPRDSNYDALRFCDPNLGDLDSRGGTCSRKCCGITEAVPTISEGEFVQSFVCKHEVLAFDYDHDGAGDGADFFDIDDEASQYHDPSEQPDDHFAFECRDLTLDDEANFFYDSGDFSFATLLDLLKKYQAKLGKYGTKRASVIDPGTEVYCPFGTFVLGGVKGITKATTENTPLVRYLNAFAKTHIGQGATWSSIIVTKGVHSKVHHDLHNLAGSWNYCASIGHHGDGGALWIATPDISEQEAGRSEVVWKNAGPGGWLPGRAHSTEESFVKFDPATKHAVLPGQGGGWHVVCYSTRGAADLDGNLVKFLKNCGFPMPKSEHGKKGATSRRPRKAVRNSIGNMAGKLSVLFGGDAPYSRPDRHV